MLEIKNLTLDFPTKRVLENITLSVEKGKVLGIVGESGSGKTMTALAIMRLLPESAHIAAGSILLEGKELLTLTEKEMPEIRGNDVAMIFQEPMTSLNPTMRIGKQVEEALLLHGEGKKKNRQAVKELALKALAEVALPNPEDLYKKYPHELSGGMRQRVMIAIGSVCHPDYLLCDEPTTALDVTTEKEILKLINRLKEEHHMGIVFITHDLKLLRGFADEVAVMCEGKVVESGTTEEIFENPKEEYTRKLIKAIPNRKNRRNWRKE